MTKTTTPNFDSKNVYLGNPEDVIRDAILRYLYRVHKSARSPKSAAKGIREIQSALKKSHGLKQQEVGSNLDYLCQKKWVAIVTEDRTFQTTKGTTQSAERTTYKISDIGIDRLEHASLFRNTGSKMKGVNITNVNGVTVVGDGNVVNTSFTDLSRSLDELKSAISLTNDISNQEKLNATADIDTLQAQLQKPSPNSSIISQLWNAIEVSVTVADFAELMQRISGLIEPLLH